MSETKARIVVTITERPAARDILALAREWAEQATDYDEDTEQQIEDGHTILGLLGVECRCYRCRAKREAVRALRAPGDALEGHGGPNGADVGTGATEGLEGAENAPRATLGMLVQSLAASESLETSTRRLLGRDR